MVHTILRVKFHLVLADQAVMGGEGRSIYFGYRSVLVVKDKIAP